MQDLSFYIWLISLSKMSSRSIHVLTNSTASFLAPPTRLPFSY